jgi:hypothetical protein
VSFALFYVDSLVVYPCVSVVVALAAYGVTLCVAFFLFCLSVCLFCSFFCVFCGDVVCLLCFVRPIFVDSLHFLRLEEVWAPNL